MHDKDGKMDQRNFAQHWKALAQFGQVYTNVEKCNNTYRIVVSHTIYIRNNMGQKCEGNCGLWVLHEILKETYPENLKKIVGAIWELPAR